MKMPPSEPTRDSALGLGHRALAPGPWPTLACAFLYFSLSCVIWVLLGALGNALAAEFGLDDWRKGLMVAVPVLGGAILRLGVGVLTDHIGARRTGLIGLVMTAVPLLLGWLWVGRFDQLLMVGLLLGVAGASFAAALPLAGRWYPPERQGLILGLVGAGNSGTAVATFLAPRLVPLVGWRGVFAWSLVPLALVFVIFALFAQDAPTQPAPKRLHDYWAVLQMRDTYWFSGFYAVTFGGFVGLCAFLPIFFRDQFQVDPVHAGTLATLCALAGSFLRPLGGCLADCWGGVRMLGLFLVAAGGLCLTVGLVSRAETAAAVLFGLMALLGMGNGAIFQLVPQRFRDEIGVVTGLVGAAGGLGGFLLPTLLGGLRQISGQFGPGFMVLGLVALATAGLLSRVGRSWRRSLPRDGARAFPEFGWEPGQP
jgi:NNP family nitrate/nitrite transporter-like MFS transporter